jgi:membrane protein
MAHGFGELLRRLNGVIWTPHIAALPVWKMHALRAVRLVIVLIRDVAQGAITLWTMSLVYTTLLSLVPMLALSFSVLKAFGVHNQIEPMLDNLLSPLGDQAPEITGRLVGFIGQMNVGVLGAVGLALLIYTVFSLMQKVEEAFNAIWHVARLRSIGERFSRYLSVLLVGPLLVFTAAGTTAIAVRSEFVQGLLAAEPLGQLAIVVGRVLPYVLVIAAFTFLYRFVPNTRVRMVPALVAGIVGGALWQTAGWAFALFVASSARYAAIYSSFAVLILFLIWLYVSWLVLLVGTAIAFYLQNPEYLYARPGEPRLSNRMRERLAVTIAYEIGSQFLAGRPPWTGDRLVAQLAIPMHSVNVVLDALVGAGLIAQVAGDPPAFVPARDPAAIPMAEVLAAVRSAGEDGFVDVGALPLPPAVEAVMDTIDRAMSESLRDLSLRALVEAKARSEPTLHAAVANPP